MKELPFLHIDLNTMLNIPYLYSTIFIPKSYQIIYICFNAVSHMAFGGFKDVVGNGKGSTSIIKLRHFKY